MKEFLITLFVLLLLSSANTARAQVDPHFSQYYAYPLWLNPALTGVVDAEARVTGNFREQWTGLSNNFKTAAISADIRQSDKIALGINIFNQKAGTAGYNHLTAHGSFAYQIPVSPDGYHKLNFGLQAGLISRSFDPSKLQMDDQYDTSIGFDPNLVSADVFSGKGSTAFDANAGIFYYDGNPAAKVNFFAGLSVAHLTQSKDKFTTGGFNSKVPMRYNVHAGATISSLGFMEVTPHLIYIKQRSGEIKAAGVNFGFGLSSDHSILFGGMYRLNDAAVGNVALHAKNLVIGLSYDYTTSILQQSGNVRGGYELSVSYIFKRKLSARDDKCPRF